LEEKVMIEIVLAIASMVSLISTMFCLAMCAFNAFRMYSEIKADKRLVANLLPFLVGAIPGVLTAAGQKARDRLCLYLMLSLICVALFALTS